MTRRRVVVTGLGIVSPVGNDVATAWANITAGKSGIGPVTHFDASTFPTRIAGEVRDFDPAQFDGWVDRYFGRLRSPAEPIPRVTATEPPRSRDLRAALTAPRRLIPIALVSVPLIAAQDSLSRDPLAMPLGAGSDATLLATQAIASQAAQSPGALTATEVESPAATAAVRAVLDNAPPAPDGSATATVTAIAKSEARRGIHTVPITEQQLYVLARSGAIGDSLRAFSPSGPTPVADYPVLRLSSSQVTAEQSDGVAAFLEFAKQPDQTALLARSGYRAGDADWKDGRTWSLVYYAGEAHHEFLKAAHNLFFTENALNPMAFKSLKRMEAEVVQMTASMLHGGPETVGTMTSGGTESIEIRPMMYIALSYDHRVVDGWDAASFVQAVKRLIEAPLLLLAG